MQVTGAKGLSSLHKQGTTFLLIPRLISSSLYPIFTDVFISFFALWADGGL